MVKLVTKPKEGRKERSMTTDQKAAERILQKSNHKEFGWTLPEDSAYKFDKGTLILKAKKAATKKEAPKKEEPKSDSSEGKD